jgi:hypothetical protein
LQHARIGQALLRGAHCGFGAIKHEVCTGHSVDQLLVRCREFGVRGDRKLARLFDRGRAAAEIEQQVLYGNRWHKLPVVGGGETRRNEIGRHRER